VNEKKWLLSQGRAINHKMRTHWAVASSWVAIRIRWPSSVPRRKYRNITESTVKFKQQQPILRS